MATPSIDNTRAKQTDQTPKHPSWLVLLVTCIGQFMVVLDISVVNVALPAIHRSLGFNESGLQWIIDLYALTFGGFLLLGGRVADLFGRKKIFVIGLGIFTAASLVGGIATSQMMLLIARGLQGFGAAVLAPATLTIITTTFTEPHERSKALATWSGVASAGGAVGVLLGGVITDTLGWRWTLFINIPIGIITILVATAVITERRNEQAPKLDVAGALAITLGLVILVYGIVRTDTYSWTAWQTVLPLGIAAAMVGAFIFIESKVATDPLIPIRFFAIKSVTGANLVMLLVGAAMFGMWFFESLYLQNVLGYSPLKAGLAFLPQPLCIAAGAITCARLVPKIGAKPILMVGPAISAGGLIWLSRIGVPGGYSPAVLFGGMLAALGIGLSFTPIAVAATSGVPMHEAGLASGLVNASRQVGGAIGLAVLATVASDATARNLASVGNGVKVVGGQVVSGGGSVTRHAVLAAQTHGFSDAFLVGAGISIVAALSGTLVPYVKPGARLAPAQGTSQSDSDIEVDGLAMPIPVFEG
ncbi:MAG TPA: MFS transporter [Acidimicrobiales bacterium]|nr:MFS transporter [Acidimicrobiales bacterium]